MRLRTVLALAFATVALGVALCGALAAQQITGERMKRRIGLEMGHLASQVRMVLDGSMYDRWRDVHILAAAARTAAPTADTRRAWVEIMRRTFPNYAWIGFADTAGTVTASTDRVLEGSSVAARPWFINGLKGGYAGDLHEAVLLAKHLEPPPDGAPWRFIDVAAPLIGQDGRTEGVVGAHLSWTWASRLTHSVLDPVIAQNPGTDVLIVDRSGAVVLGPDDLQGETLGDYASSWRAAGLGASYAIETWPNGVTYLVGASRTMGRDDYPGLGWTVLVRRDVALAFAPARRLARELLIGGMVLAGIAALLGCVLARRIGGPLRTLATAADSLEHQSMRSRLPEVTGTDEIRRLSSALNRMLAGLAERDASLADANAGLERRISERTRELEAMRDQADAASASKSRFLATMSHELRTPLNGILGYTQLLQLEGGLNAQQTDRLAAMLAAGQHLREMISRVLDMSAVEAGRVDLQIGQVDPVEIAEACLDFVRPTAEANGLRCTLHVVPGTPAALSTDPRRLRQILLNLLGNAVKFTRQGSVDIRLLSSSSLGLRAEIIDTGPGIPAEHRAELFRDFERLGHDAAVEGSGLGLALSARLAALLGGRLGYDDNPAGGSIFWLELPPAPSCAEADIADHPAAAPLPARTLRVLVVDDVAMNRDIAQSFLRAAGHDVVTASGGLEAVDLAATATFDVVLMDVRMTDLDGLEATRRIRALPGRSGQVPIVAVTAQAFAEQLELCRLAGMNHHLVKPYSVAGLHDVVLRAARLEPTGPGDAPAPTGALDSLGGPATPDADWPVLDEDAFERTAALLDAQGVQDCLQIIAERGRALLALLQAGDRLASVDPSLARAAHTLGGSAGMFGFLRLSMLARQFEQAADAVLPDAAPLGQALAVAIEASLDRIAALVPAPFPQETQDGPRPVSAASV